MRAFAFILPASAAVLSGCVDTTVEKQRIADEATCRGYGFRPWTSAFAECRQRIGLSRRTLLRVERGKGGRDRNAMLSADLLALLREWWVEGHLQGILHREGWLFPGQSWDRPISTRQLHRVVV